MAEITIMESIKKIRYRPQIGMSLVFIDQCRPSDLTTVRLPKIGEVCTVRSIIPGSSLDTGESIVGLKLEGYYNPISDGTGEYIYESERFVPHRYIQEGHVVEANFEKLSIRSREYSEQIVNFHSELITFLQGNKCLHNLDSDGNGVCSVLPAIMGCIPLHLRYTENHSVVARLYMPIRITKHQIDKVIELISRMNSAQLKPRYSIDFERNLIFSTSLCSQKDLSEGCNWRERLLDRNIRQIETIYSAFTKVSNEGACPSDVVDEYEKQKNDQKKFHKSLVLISPDLLQFN
tara:strand:+ start:324 stop:1196 length:873 start_codon:yes stop_codon:yes gene_type:complete